MASVGYNGQESSRHLVQEAPLTFSTSVGFASVEEITPDTTPQITLISNVSSAMRKKIFGVDLETKAVCMRTTSE